MTDPNVQASTDSAPQRPSGYYIERQFTGKRTLEMALASLMKAHSEWTKGGRDAPCFGG